MRTIIPNKFCAEEYFNSKWISSDNFEEPSKEKKRVEPGPKED